MLLPDNDMVLQLHNPLQHLPGHHVSAAPIFRMQTWHPQQTECTCGMFWLLGLGVSPALQDDDFPNSLGDDRKAWAMEFANVAMEMLTHLEQYLKTTSECQGTKSISNLSTAHST